MCRRKKSHNEENLVSTPAVRPAPQPRSLFSHFHVTHLFSQTLTPSCLVSSFPSLSPSRCRSVSLYVPVLISPGGPLYPGPPPASSSLPSLAHCQWEAGRLTPLEQQEAAAAGVRLYGAAGCLCQKSCQAKDKRPLPVLYWGTDYKSITDV